MSISLNYIDWKNDNKSILEAFFDKKVIMLYSGGKDCSVILYYLHLAGKEFGFNFETIAGTYPNHVFSDKEIEKLENFWRLKGIDIIWLNADESDSVLVEAEKDEKYPCRLCHKIKRNLLRNYLKNYETEKRETVVIISFTLWDIVTYSVEYLLGNVYKPINNTSNNIITEDRFIETSHRFYPFIKLHDGLSIFKPLLRYNNDEIIKVVSEEKIPFSSIECKYKKTRTKRILFDYYKEMNLSFDYDKVFKFFNHSLKLHDKSYYINLDKDDFIKVL